MLCSYKVLCFTIHVDDFPGHLTDMSGMLCIVLLSDLRRPELMRLCTCTHVAYTTSLFLGVKWLSGDVIVISDEH